MIAEQRRVVQGEVFRSRSGYDMSKQADPIQALVQGLPQGLNQGFKVSCRIGCGMQVCCVIAEQRKGFRARHFGPEWAATCHSRLFECFSVRTG